MSSVAEIGPSPRLEHVRSRLRDFMDERIYPDEAVALRALDRDSGPGCVYPATIADLRAQARERGLWNLFLADTEHGAGLSNWEYGHLCEEMGRSPLLAPVVFNCAPPDSGNVEILIEHGTADQRERWLEPLLAGEIRGCFSMTEPEVAGSDPTALRTSARLDGDEWVIDGHKWFTSGAVGAGFAIVMAVTDTDAPPHRRASMIIVPTDTPGFELVRSIGVMGHTGGTGHCEIRYERCRVPRENLLGARGAGFAIAQDRLGPGRIHHSMRAVGSAERAMDLLCERALARQVLGGKLADKQFVQDFIARSRMEIDQARLLTLHAAALIDARGKKAARQEISMIKVVAANVATAVVDRAIQVNGALGLSDDSPLGGLWVHARALRLADGADEVHKVVIAGRELARQAARIERPDAHGAHHE